MRLLQSVGSRVLRQSQRPSERDWEAWKQTVHAMVAEKLSIVQLVLAECLEESQKKRDCSRRNGMDNGGGPRLVSEDC